ncbi:peptidoglycan-binding domain-containing protein [Blautia marasmi]|uniref:peptidoglycan-binding domain-containing protein n=1 Tax=Blautia marasmi TaxID=1917868 RepID=UPI000CF2E970|nr:peptidoglycan-binding domain-containing protein [Blautia marasmi]
MKSFCKKICVFLLTVIMIFTSSFSVLASSNYDSNSDLVKSDEWVLPGGVLAKIHVINTIVDVPSWAVLQYGSNNQYVYLLQACLKHLGHYSGELDSNFGPATLAALKSFQGKWGLSVDGSCGPATWMKFHQLLLMQTVQIEWYWWF